MLHEERTRLGPPLSPSVSMTISVCPMFDPLRRKIELMAEGALCMQPVSRFIGSETLIMLLAQIESFTRS